MTADYYGEVITDGNGQQWFVRRNSGTQATNWTFRLALRKRINLSRAWRADRKAKGLRRAPYRWEPLMWFCGDDTPSGLTQTEIIE